ncbi:AAA family ATPase [Youngiibacter multivorans]|uniref:Stage 0 sporulation protein A homolog n=1 Tax=Youngiibacter multivorans TaxID=937251 RepID=A0ABS4G8B0_9CLOT|nr:AAA family ATPase [Youngiibacter multivorans]MBP1920798.1 pilus assembly protein CpaE [Youngiibacter multivorans]
MDRIKVLVLEATQEERNTISEILSNVEYIILVGESDSEDEAVDFIEDNSVDVVLLGAKVGEDGYRIAEKISNEYPDIAIIMMEDDLKEETMHKAIFAGAKDVLIKPFTPSKLVDTIYRVNQLAKKKVMIHKEGSTKARRKSTLGQVMTVFSTKGGVGKTFVSINLAVALAKNTGKRVVLVDLDLDFGNAALALNILPKFTLTDIVDDIRNIDADLIESYLIPHDSGIKVLPANAQPQMSEFINAEHIDIILRTLQSAFDYVVVDMPARFHDPVNPALAIADKLLIVTTPEVSTVRNVKAALITLNDLNYPKSKIRVVLNRHDNRGEIKPKDVEATLNMGIYATLAADYKDVISSLNQGIPIVIRNPRDAVTKDFISLAKKLVDDAGVKERN